MKTCFKCGIHKPFSDFYRHGGMADGYLGKCKDCAKADVRANRTDNLDRYRAYDRSRANKPDRVAAREAYTKTEAYAASRSKATKRYRGRNPLRAIAHTAVNKAIRDGRLVPWPVCAVPDCTNTKTEAHHPNYAEPLSVVWLCGHHHRAAHVLGRMLMRELKR